GLIAFIRCDDLETFPGAPPFPGVDPDGIEQREHLGTLIPVGRRGPVRPGHPARVGETVDQDPFALAPAGDTRAAPLARGKKRRRRRQTPSESCPVLRPHPECALASWPTYHPPAIAAATDAWRSSIPIAAHGGRHTSDNR